MKKGEIYEGVIEKVDFPNKGIVITDGQKVTVKNGMPGQKVRFMINKKRSDVQREDFWKCWRSLRLKQENRSVVFFRNVEDACIRPCPMKTSSK